MAISNVVAKYRPLKIGFLVKEGQIGELLYAFKVNTFLIGGMNNLILPISEDNFDEIEKTIKNSTIDVLQPIGGDHLVKEMCSKFPFLRSPNNYSHELFYQSWKSKKQVFAYLDVFNTIEKNYHKFFKGASRKAKGNLNYLVWDKEDALENWLLISIGTYRSELNLEDPFEEAYIKGLRAKKYEITNKEKVPSDFSRELTPLSFTTLNLTPFGGHRYAAGIFVGDETDFNELLLFWNLRAAGCDLEFLPIKNNERVIDYIQCKIKALEEKPQGSTAFYFSAKRKQEEAEYISSLFTYTKGKHFIAITNSTLYENFINLPIERLSWEFTQAITEKDAGRVIVTINLPEKKFVFDDTERDNSKQEFAISIDPMSEIGNEGFFIQPPYIRSLNEFYARELAFNPWSIRVEKEGVAKIIELQDKYLQLRPIEQSKLIFKLFEDAGIDATTSQAGLLALRIINKLGSVDDARVFKIGGVRDLFFALQAKKDITKVPSLPWSTIEQTIKAGGGFEKHKRLYIEPRNELELKPRMVFDFLLKKGFLRAGLELYCKNCNLENWLSLKSIDDEWICEYCGFSNLTPVDLYSRGDWRFRKSGLFAKDNNQEGSIPVILTLQFFDRLFRNNFVYTTSLNLKKHEDKLETDFALIKYKDLHTKPIEVVIGECKSKGGKIDNNDVNNLQKIADELKKKGYAVYITFTKAANNFDESEIELFKALNSKGYKLILLTNKELEPYDPYEEDVEEKLPNKYVLDLDGASLNSNIRYLR